MYNILTSEITFLGVFLVPSVVDAVYCCLVTELERGDGAVPSATVMVTELGRGDAAVPSATVMVPELERAVPSAMVMVTKLERGDGAVPSATVMVTELERGDAAVPLPWSWSQS